MLAYASRPAILYGAAGTKAAWTDEAKLGVGCWIAHFVKREFETFFVHKFSRPTMYVRSFGWRWFCVMGGRVWWGVI